MLECIPPSYSSSLKVRVLTGRCIPVRPSPDVWQWETRWTDIEGVCCPRVCGLGTHCVTGEDMHQLVLLTLHKHITPQRTPKTVRGKADSIPASWKEKTLHRAHLQRWMDSSLQQLLLCSQLEQKWKHQQPLHFFHFLSSYIGLLS